MPKTSIHLEDGYQTTVDAREHQWHADLENDGGNSAPTPEELLLGALGSCMAQTARLYAARKGWQIDRIDVTLDFERFKGSEYAAYDGDSAFVHEIREHIIIQGPLTDEQRARILEIMGKCPVRRILTSPTFIVEAQLETE